MPSGFEVTCANKNQAGTIVRVSGCGWSLSHQEAIQKIIGNQLRLYIYTGDEYFDIGVRGGDNDSNLVLEPNAKRIDEVEQLVSY